LRDDKQNRARFKQKTQRQLIGNFYNIFCVASGVFSSINFSRYQMERIFVHNRLKLGTLSFRMNFPFSSMIFAIEIIFARFNIYLSWLNNFSNVIFL